MGGSKRQLQLVLQLQDQASKELKRVVGELDAAERSSREWASTLKNVGRQLLYVGTAAAGFLGYGIKIAADLETAEVGLQTLLGSAEEADRTVERLKREAARTPFELPGLTQATQLLSSVTKDGNRSIDILLDIGEALAAMGKGQEELDRIIVNLQQVGSIGYATMVDIKQFAYAGIPIFEMLAEKTGLAGDALSTFIGEGNVTFELLTQMFDEANDAGGQFFNAFQNQSGTFNQTLSNLKDSFGIFLADIAVGTGVFAGVTQAMQLTANVLGNYRQIISEAQSRTAQFLADLDSSTGIITLFQETWASLVSFYNANLRPALLELWETLKPLQPFLVALAQVIGATLIGALALAIVVLGSLAAGLIQVLTWATELANFLIGPFVRAWDAITSAMAGTMEWVDALIEGLEEILTLISRVAEKMPGAGGFSSIGKALGKVLNVDDAIIAPNGNIISTHPDDYLIATKDPHSLSGGSINLTITGNTFLDEDAAEKMGDLIIRKLKFSHAI